MINDMPKQMEKAEIERMTDRRTGNDFSTLLWAQIFKLAGERKIPNKAPPLVLGQTCCKEIMLLFSKSNWAARSFSLRSRIICWYTNISSSFPESTLYMGAKDQVSATDGSYSLMKIKKRNQHQKPYCGLSSFDAFILPLMNCGI